MLVARISRQTTKVCVDLVDVCNRSIHPWTCDSLPDMAIEIERAGCCEQPAQPHRVWCGCGWKDVPAPPAEPKLRVRYNLYSINEEGIGCFYLDDLLLKAEAGRYDVAVLHCGVVAGRFQFHLENKTRVRRVTSEVGDVPFCESACPPEPCEEAR